MRWHMTAWSRSLYQDKSSFIPSESQSPLLARSLLLWETGRMYMETHQAEYNLPIQWLDKWLCKRGNTICREMERLLVCKTCMWSSFSFDAGHLWLYVQKRLLSSESQLEECRTSSAELSLHSCWCQLLCPPCSLPDSFYLLLLRPI